MKGIILAGGSGTRLYPVTKAMSKQMVPIYDKPMIYYPMSVLMLAGIREILIISTARDIVNFKELFRDGSELGLKVEYAIQEEPNGLAEAFIIGEEFIGDDNVAMILGDNIFYGQSFSNHLREAASLEKGAMIFGYYVQDPRSFGVVEFDKENKVISLEEKPEKPKSKYAIPGLYFYDNSVVKKAKELAPSTRGELEITDLNKVYMKEGNLRVNLLGRGMAWLDTGTHASMLQASNFVEAVQNTQGTYIACLEEIAYRQKWINTKEVIQLAKSLMKTGYGKYLVDIVNEIEKVRFSDRSYQGGKLMSNFNFIETKIKDLYIIEPKVFGDNRGYFMESYNKKAFEEAGLTMKFVQDNESKSKKGVLRGMHFQTKHTQGKLVRVTEGAVYDVAVDLRKGSPTFGMWEGVLLTSENKKQFYVPEGFAHGFLVVSETATFHYKCTDFYAPEYDSGLLWNDQEVGIEWPLEGIEEILLSEKDKKQKTLKELDLPFEYK